MDGPATDPYKRAAETKKQRTRAALIQAAFEVMDRVGMDGRVEDIANAAGVSTPTFYNFYKSRNELCMDAYRDVLHMLADALYHDMALTARIASVWYALFPHRHVLRAALIWRLERPASEGTYSYFGVSRTADNPTEWSVRLSLRADIIDETAALLAAPEVCSPENDSAAVWFALFFGALSLIDHLVNAKEPNSEALAQSILDVCHRRYVNADAEGQRIIAEARDQAAQITAQALTEASRIKEEAQAQKDAVLRQISELARTLGQ